MASNNTLANGHHDPESQSNVLKILNQAREDLTSQSHRILPNFSLLQGLYQTLLAGGIVDDRKYIVTAWTSTGLVWRRMLIYVLSQ